MFSYLKDWHAMVFNAAILFWAALPDILNYLVGIDIHTYFPTAPAWVVPALAAANIVMHKYATGSVGTKQ